MNDDYLPKDSGLLMIITSDIQSLVISYSMSMTILMLLFIKTMTVGIIIMQPPN